MMSAFVSNLKLSLKEALYPDYYRYAHSLFVYEISENLIETSSDKDLQKSIQIAALFHDVCKNMKLEQATDYAHQYHETIPHSCVDFPVSLHGFMARLKLKYEFGITDHYILQAVEFHTTGCPHLSHIGMLLYISDFLASLDNRKLFNEICTLGTSHVYKAAYEVTRYKIQEVKNKGKTIHPLSLDFQDWLVEQTEFSK